MVKTIDYRGYVCIVGSGVGGGTLALKLVEAGLDVVILEAGGDKRNRSVQKDIVGREFGLRTTTSIELGGTSNLWHGVLAPLDKEDFEVRPWVEKSGWPISKSDLDPYYEEAGKLFSIYDYKLYDQKERPDHIVEKLLEMEFDKEVFENKIYQQPQPTLSFKEPLLELENKGRLRILRDTVALEVIEAEGRIESIICGAKDGSLINIVAKDFVISAGALETPRLLLNSNINNQNIGRYLMDHPMGNLCQVSLKEPKRAHIYSDYKITSSCKIKTSLKLLPNQQRLHKALNHSFYFRPSFSKGIDNVSEKVKLSMLTFKDGKISIKDVVNLIKNWNVVFQMLTYKFSLNVKYKYADLFFVTEQVPNIESCVSLSEKKDQFGYRIAKVDWKVSGDELEGIKSFYKDILLEGLSPENHGYEFTHKYEDLNWNGNFTSAAHHVGTCRMSSTDIEGVVDKNLKVFGLNNLYICDGSVFPTSGNVNSSFTISALACRLSKYLSGDWK